MTLAALVTMLFTWVFITYYTVKFFIKVLKNPIQKETQENIQ